MDAVRFQPAVTFGKLPQVPLSTVKARLFQRHFFLPIQNPTSELWLIGTAFMAFLFEQGRASRTGEYGRYNFGNTIKVLLEAALTSQLVSNFTGAYPVMALGKTIFDVGYAETPSDRWAIAIKDLATAGSAYGGMQLGFYVTDRLHQQDARTYLRELGRLEAVTRHPQTLPEAMRGMVEPLRTLERQAHALQETQSAKTREALRRALPLREIEEGMTRTKETLLALLEKVSAQDMGRLRQEIREPLEQLTRQLKNAQKVQWLRWLNGAFGYILGIAMIGLPVSRILVKHFERTGKLAPGTWEDGYRLPAQWIQMLLGSEVSHRSGGGHGGGHSPSSHVVPDDYPFASLTSRSAGH